VTELVDLVRTAYAQARAGDFEGLRASLNVGVPVNVCNEKGDTLLMLACYYGHVRVAELLLERGADPERRNDRGQSPLDGAAFKGDVAIATTLIDAGAQVNAAGPDGRTALFYAAMFDQDSMVELLIERGSDAFIRDAGGLTPLALAQAMGAQKTPGRLATFVS
jgi:ankyrin repeat protein